MTHYSNVPLDFPEAHRFADLNGIKQDLEWVIRVGPKYFEYKKQLNFDLTESLFIALVVKYGRVHAIGERRRIPAQWIKCLPEEELEAHNYVINLRNKYVAHSVNNFEENIPVAYIKDINSENPEFNQVSVQHTQVVAVSREDINLIIGLAKKFLEQVNDFS